MAFVTVLLWTNEWSGRTEHHRECFFDGEGQRPLHFFGEFDLVVVGGGVHDQS